MGTREETQSWCQIPLLRIHLREVDYMWSYWEDHPANDRRRCLSSRELRLTFL